MAATAQPQQEKTLLMTEGSIWKSILLFSVPLILGNLLQQLYNTADSIIVGNFLGSNALAAVGSSGSPIYLLIGFSQGVAVGAGVVVSQYLGAKDKKETRIAVHTSLAIAVILGLILDALPRQVKFLQILCQTCAVIRHAKLCLRHRPAKPFLDKFTA